MGPMGTDGAQFFVPWGPLFFFCTVGVKFSIWGPMGTMEAYAGAQSVSLEAQIRLNIAMLRLATIMQVQKEILS